ncbi:MAG: reverse transcriptase/maturase family protein [Nanoarchaeota archaeon]
MRVHGPDNDFDVNGDNRNLDNNNGAFGMTFCRGFSLLVLIMDLYGSLCSYDNLLLAYKKARKRKTKKSYVIEFEKNLKENLLLLRSELLLHCYSPKPLVNFTIHDPKTRKISKSDFRDRVVHHAICNIIEPIFEKGFIYDSYANRIGKGTLKAVQRFDFFKRKASKNNTAACYVLKSDIKKYFENVDHKILLGIISRKIADPRIIWLVKKILSNPVGRARKDSKGMPLGNLTSQFFANVYLNKMDNFVKHKLKARFYIRYVDDFVIFEANKKKLEFYKEEINIFLENELKIQLHPDKSKILRLGRTISFLGFRAFYYHKLLKKSNMRKMKHKLKSLAQECKLHEIDYDSVYDFLEGWIAYAKNANAYELRGRITAEFEKTFANEISTKEINRYFKAVKNVS